MRDRYFYIEFDIGSEARFHTLHRFFTALQAEKNRIFKSGDGRAQEADYHPAKAPQWFNLLDDAAIEWFNDNFDYDSEEGRTYWTLWDLTSPKIRDSHPMFNVPRPWSFDSMIRSIFCGAYALVDLVKETESKGVLYYDPFSGPFGGTECLVVLIESFGHTVTYDYWHSGPHLRGTGTVGWDYALAKRLVAAGRGFKSPLTRRIREVFNRIRRSLGC